MSKETMHTITSSDLLTDSERIHGTKIAAALQSISDDHEIDTFTGFGAIYFLVNLDGVEYCIAAKKSRSQIKGEAQ